MVVEKPIDGRPERTFPKKGWDLNSDADTLALIRTSFAGREKLIERVFGESASFRTLCEDYRQCNDALQRFEVRSSVESVPRSQEYADLLVELGSEIQNWLEAIEVGVSYSSRGTDDL